MKQVSIRKKEDYELEGKKGGFYITDFDLYHDKKKNDLLGYLSLLFLYFVVGLIVGIGVGISFIINNASVIF